MTKNILGEEVTRQVHHIRCPFSRPGYFTSACAILGETVTLIDSGTSKSPEEAIFPYLRQLGKEPSKVSKLILTHAHFDHCGGASAINGKSGATIAVHRRDEPLLEDPTLLNRRLNARFPELFSSSSSPGYERVKPDLILEDGDEITLDDRALRVVHTPGHSEGSLALIDEEAGLCISGDSIQGRGERRPLLFSSSTDYVNSIKRLTTEPIETLILGHPMPPFKKGILRGEEVKDFLLESLKAIEELREEVLRTIKEGYKALTLREICAKMPEAQPVTISCIVESLQHKS